MPTKTGEPDRMGSTFAERKAAREGNEFVPPNPAEIRGASNTTFAERAGRPKKTAAKVVDTEAEEVEDKAVSKKKATRKAAKKA